MFNLERMIEACNAPSMTLPSGLTLDERLKFITASASVDLKLYEKYLTNNSYVIPYSVLVESDNV